MTAIRSAGTGLTLAGALLLAASSATGAGEAGNTAQRCVAMAASALPPGVEITSARHVAALSPAAAGDQMGWAVTSPLPAHCLIEGMIDRRIGAGGQEYGIGFSIALPDDWQGRFLLQGGGGSNGVVRAPVGPVASNGVPALARGFAVISHDSGHKGAAFDSSFRADQRAALDFAESSVRTVTVIGKAIAETYYRKPVAHSYITGCSTGGREGMLAFQRYPELFDGLVVGAPAMRTRDSNLAIEAMQVGLNRIAPRHGEGRPDIKALLTPAVRQTLLDGMLAACDGLDGLEDGMIENVGQCRFRAGDLACRAGDKSADCLDGDLAAALDAGFAAPRDNRGRDIYTHFPWDTGMIRMQGGFLPTGEAGPLGPPSAAMEIDLDQRNWLNRNDPLQRLIDTSYWTNLNTFLDRGGKVMFFHGVSDFWFSPWAIWAYYQRAAEANGAAFTDASRFYMVPGMLHCSGGNAYDQFDMLGALVNWVEADKAPEAIIAARSDGRSATRPLCPYPAHAAYRGGDEDKAASFVCAQ